MTTTLTNTYLDLDKRLFDHMPSDTIAQILSCKCVHDRILKRDVQSIFDPTTMGHKYSDREKEVIDH